MTKAQKRGALLKNRLDILNKYIVEEDGTGKTFEQFLRENKIGYRDFISGLPNHLTDIPAVDYNELFSYAEKMNEEYFNQYLAHLKDAEMSGSEGEYHEAAANPACPCDTYDGWAKCLCPPSKGHHSDGESSGVVDGDNLPAYANAPVPHFVTNYNEYNASGDRKKRRDERRQHRDERRQHRDERKENKRGGERHGLHVANQNNPAFVVARSAFKTCLELNILQLAYNLNRIKEKSPSIWKKVKTKWYNIGGDQAKLEKAIDKGKNKRGLFGKKMSADGEFRLDGTYSVAGVDDAVVAGYIATATAIIAAMKPIISEFKTSQGEPTDTPDVATLPDDQGGAVSDALKVATPDGGASDDNVPDASFWSKNKMALSIGIGLVVLTLGGIAIVHYTGKK